MIDHDDDEDGDDAGDDDEDDDDDDDDDFSVVCLAQESHWEKCKKVALF